jgi:hypothetical protein
VWKEFTDVVFSKEFEELLLKKLQLDYTPQGHDSRIQTDVAGYSVGVHADSVKKLLTMQVCASTYHTSTCALAKLCQRTVLSVTELSGVKARLRGISSIQSRAPCMLHLVSHVKTASVVGETSMCDGPLELGLGLQLYFPEDDKPMYFYGTCVHTTKQYESRRKSCNGCSPCFKKFMFQVLACF